MNAARYFVNGYATGFNDGLKAGGVEPTPEPETDEDFEAFKNSADPSENQTIFTVYADTNNPYNIATLTAFCNVISDATAHLKIDWGDGTSETYDLTIEPKVSVQINHTYTDTGNFTLTVTSDNLGFCDFWRLESVSNSIFWRAAKYGEKIHVEKYVQGIGALPLINKLQFIKIPNDTDFSVGSFFKNCVSLNKIIYEGENLTSIPIYTFRGCVSLQFDNWDFSEVAEIDSYAFYNCFKLTSINIPLCTSVGDYAFQSTNIKHIQLTSCTSLGKNAFDNCYMLESVNIPKCQTISYCEFQGCVGLTSINIPECTSVGNYAFSGCQIIVAINTPLCASVGDYAFNGCFCLKKTTFADNCTFGLNAFNLCHSLFPKPDGTF